MVRFKIIAVKIEESQIKDLLEVVCARRDTIEKTGVVIRYTEHIWVADLSVPYTGGYGTSNERSFEQKRVVLNEDHNQRRMEALHRLAGIGGSRVIAALLVSDVRHPMGESEESGDIKFEFVVDDLSFEDELDETRRDLIESMLANISPEEVQCLFEGDIRLVNRVCQVLHRDFPEQYVDMIESLSVNYPNSLLRLACRLRSVQPEGSSIKNHEVVVMFRAIEDGVLANAELKELVMLHYLARKREDIRRRIESKVVSRLTVGDAVALINMSHMDVDMGKIVFRYVAQNFTSPEVGKLRAHSFVNHVARVVGSYMEGSDPAVLVRNWYPNCPLVDKLPSYTYKMRVAQNKLRAVGAVEMMDALLPKIKQGLEEMFDQDQGDEEAMNLLPVFDMVKSPSSIGILILIARRSVGMHGSNFSRVLMCLGEQNLSKNNLVDLEQLFMEAEKHPEVTKVALAQIAQIMKELDPNSVKGRTLHEWMKGRQPWAASGVKRRLRRLEAEEKRILALQAMDKKVPYLFRIAREANGSVRTLTGEQVSTIIGNLPVIVGTIEGDPSFDYFYILCSDSVIERVIQERPSQGLRLLELLIINIYENIGQFYFPPDPRIRRLVSAIGKLEFPGGIAVLRGVRRLNRSSKFDRRRRFSLDRKIRETITKLEAKG